MNKGLALTYRWFCR